MNYPAASGRGIKIVLRPKGRGIKPELHNKAVQADRLRKMSLSLFCVLMNTLMNNPAPGGVVLNPSYTINQDPRSC